MKQSDPAQTERLDKFISNRGVTSRRSIKKLLKISEVTVNGKRVTESGTRISPTQDMVLINGKKIGESKLVYFLLNKPVGIVSTVSDEYGRENVVSLVETPVRVFPVGRLDKDTSGLILLTNDGELTHKLTHPKFHVPKTYHLQIRGKLTGPQKKAFQKGVLLSDGITQPAGVSIIEEGKQSLVEVVLHEGRYRQIRRMCETVGIQLLHLERVAFGPLKLEDLDSGGYRELTEEEVNLLKQAVLRDH